MPAVFTGLASCAGAAFSAALTSIVTMWPPPLSAPLSPVPDVSESMPSSHSMMMLPPWAYQPVDST
jgi:membrane-associated phospholipid phosphatase